MKKKITKEFARKLIIDIIFICAGCAIGSFASIGIMIPNGLSSGGITGIARVLSTITPMNFSVLYYIGAIIILVSCFLLLGMREARKIVLLSILYPAFLTLFEYLDVQLLDTKDITLAVIYVGVIGGISSGLVFSRGYSFGGSDTVAKIIQKRLFPFVPMSKILLVIDAVVIIISGLVFGRNIALYALVSQVISTKTIEFVMFGFDSKLVQLEIISSKHEEIAKYVLNDIGRGVSNVTIRGEYTKEEKSKIITICSPRESMLIRDFIVKADRNAFVSVVHVETVWGEGVGFNSLTQHTKE